MKTENFKKNLTIFAASVALVISFILGWIMGFNEHVSLLKSAKAEEPKENISNMMSSTRYETIYVNGVKYIVFSNYTGSDIEVVKQ